MPILFSSNKRRTKRLLDEAEQASEEGRFEYAINLAQKALEIDGSNGDALYLLSRNEYDNAKNNSDSGYFWESYCHISQAIDLEREKIGSEGDDGEGFNKLLKYYSLQAKIVQNWGAYPDELEKVYQEILEINPNLDTLVKLVEFKIGRKEGGEALALIEKVVEISGNKKEILVNYAEKLQGQDLISEAISCYRQLLEIESNAEFCLRKAMCHSIIAQHREAVVELDRAVKMEPEFDSAWLQKAIAHLRLAEYELAQECHHRANVHKLSQKEKGIYWFNYASVLCYLENPEAAKFAIDKAIKLEPNNLIYLKNKGVILEVLGLFSEARAVYGQIKKIKPTDNILQKEALVCLKTKEYDDSFRLFNQIYGSFFEKHNEELGVIAKGMSYFFKQPKENEVSEVYSKLMRDWATVYLCTVFQSIYEQEETSQKTINRLWEVCGDNLRKLENNLNYALKSNAYFMDRNNCQKNIYWINTLKRTLGSNQLGRDGIYFLEQILEYWETGNNEVLAMLSEGEKELVKTLS